MTTEIIICNNCNGKGTTVSKELEDYHHGTYNYTVETCSICKGSGRLIKTITTTIEPYDHVKHKDTGFY